MRTLIIGLGGTGGKVLHNLYALLSQEEKNSANSIYLDLDRRDTDALSALGVRTIRISTADTVRDLAASLGEGDGVYDWLPCTDADGRFLASGTDDGASQYRYKSRLCLANFLSNPSNELKQALQQLCRPGITISRDTLRVMIVSSVAGGTGSGTFIELALYVRKFFRDIGHPEIRIMGLFACPELFAQTLTREGNDENKRIAMYANAYAAMRELNAMNLAVAGQMPAEGGYGKFIKMSVNTRSEGYLFDSKDSRFSRDYNTKPFDLLYFVDLANREGGILGDLNHYYQTMADVAYTRLFSEMEFTIRSDESNELGSRTTNPTAIYGSAGYARIIYPYEDILRYLAENKTYEELDTKWFLMENKWNNYSAKQRQIAEASGRHWAPSAQERAEVFLTNMDKELNNPKSPFQAISAELGRNADGSADLATRYIDILDDAVRTSIGIDGHGEATPIKDGAYSLGNLKPVQEARRAMLGYCDTAINDENNTYLQRLSTLYSSARNGLSILSSALSQGIMGNAVMLASAMFPTDKTSAALANSEKDPVNLYTSVLYVNDTDIHPMAARYLLYRIRTELRNEIDGISEKSSDAILNDALLNMDLCLDTNPNDGEDKVSDVVNSIDKLLWGKNRMAEKNLDMFIEQYSDFMKAVINGATKQMKRQAYSIVLENLDILITQYEGLYDNMSQYRTMLKQRADSDLVLHDDDEERDIYIGASPEMLKHYYYEQESVSNALASGNQEIYASAGKAIYEALIQRTWRVIRQKNAKTLSHGDWDPQDMAGDHYEDLGNIFDNIVTTYTRYLRERATYLQTTAMSALYRESCERCGLDPETDLSNNVTAENQVLTDLITRLQDLIAKAQPLLRYNDKNVDGYFLHEKNGSQLYHHLGLHPSAVEELRRIFHVKDHSKALEELKTRLSMGREAIVSPNYDDREIFCFGAVHGLQPTQIDMFREDVDNSYYYYYQRRLAVAAATHSMAETPHIDKRWHVRGAIPYISAKLEMEWNEKSMKALLYLMLQRQLCFDYDAMNTPRFFAKLHGQSDYIQWPEGSPINKSNLSRLLEFLGDQEGLIEKLAGDLDKIVDYQVATLSNYIHSLSVYKAGMTRNELLRRMRCDMLVYEARDSEVTASHGKNARKSGSNLANDEDTAAAMALYESVTHEVCDEIVLDQKKTMGGLLEFAWLLHKSEERLGEDRDFGEALLKCAAGILEKFCRGMYGDGLSKTSTSYKNYVNLYNSAATKFLQEYVVATARKRKLTPDQLVSTDRNMESLGPVITEGNTADLDVPDCIRGTDEFDWISRNWVLLGDILNG